MIRGLISKKGELFAYLKGDELYTLDWELTGRLDRANHQVVDLAGKPIWRLYGDTIYHLDQYESLGYFSEPRPGWMEE
ncbi:MAG: hypothetical protein QNJ45_19365 [Ardenticatenaceae bacterium]|nr:hypothetical protein [Ardenticatenaceae bacterium]